MFSSELRSALTRDFGSMVHSNLLIFHLLSRNANTQVQTSKRYGKSLGIVSEALSMAKVLIKEGTTRNVLKQITLCIGVILETHGCLPVKQVTALLIRKGFIDFDIDARHLFKIIGYAELLEINFVLVDVELNEVKFDRASNKDILVNRNDWRAASRDLKNLIVIGKQRGIGYFSMSNYSLAGVTARLLNHSSIVTCSWRNQRTYFYVPVGSRLSSAIEIAFSRTDKLPLYRLVPTLERALRAQSLYSLIKSNTISGISYHYPQALEIISLLRNHSLCEVVGGAVYWYGGHAPLSLNLQLILSVMDSQSCWNFEQLKQHLAVTLKNAGLPHSPGYIKKTLSHNPIVYVDTKHGRRNYRYRLIDK